MEWVKVEGSDHVLETRYKGLTLTIDPVLQGEYLRLVRYTVSASDSPCFAEADSVEDAMRKAQEYIKERFDSNNEEVGSKKDSPLWQLCPKCNGVGILARPPYLPHGINTWADSGTGGYECNLCKGKMVINRLTGSVVK